ncbi:shikimate kinase [Luteipulveratus halotolerans]|uniref:Shikimate kinase n=1 Tax=Luteipulveratus halotolerans TaxID=1631356 RepID=A0A0L6CHP5_9MICO|nr:shikimate kinase [Luteipulveratus halotolerans]KNX37322.1 shikimate kinase [Luteipulveratus halotolerans]
MVTRPRVVLIGPPGSGKTTAGEALAERLGIAFLDSDQLVEQSAGRTISEIFVEDGEPVFRRMEADAVRRALETHDGVLALGGGAPMQKPVAEALHGHVVVFLDVTITDAARRVGFDGTRPLLAVNPRATWTRLMQERRPTYERLATHRVDTGGRDVKVVVDEVAALIESESR